MRSLSIVSSATLSRTKFISKQSQLFLTLILCVLSFLPFSFTSYAQNDTFTTSLDSGLDSWSSWGHDILNSRFQPFSGLLRADTVGRLKLKWAFVFPGQAQASSQPAIVGDTLYVGGYNAHFYALNARTGQIKWDYDTASYTGPLPTGVTNAVRDGASVVGDKVYFGDNQANLYALSIRTGTLLWAKKLDPSPLARLTGSPLVWEGRIYQGVSSIETGLALDPTYPCCSFRGSLVALNAGTGSELWRYYPITQTPQLTGYNAIGTPQYGPAGAPIWNSPAIDPLDSLVTFGTGQNYTTPATDHTDSLIALDLRTGQERWHNQLTPNDTWNLSCNPELIGYPAGSGPNCPTPTANDHDFDFGSSPNVFIARDKSNGRLKTLVGDGQKSGIYHALDAKTGQIVWQTQLSVSGPGGGGGIQWGSSWDGEHLYVATHIANPGTLFALDPSTGQVMWHTANPSDGCTTGGAAGDPNCKLALPAATSVIPGVVFEGSWDGKMRAYNSSNGQVIWQYDTRRSFTGTNGIVGQGGSFNGAGASITSAGMVFVNSGYQPYPVNGGMAGNVLLAFGL